MKATFVGHDHTNDWCKLYEGVQLCYEGSPGYQAYGRDGWARRSRVTLVEDFGRRVVSWKRLDDVDASVVDRETLWTSEKESPAAGQRLARVFKDLDVDSLPSRSQANTPSQKAPLADVCALVCLLNALKASVTCFKEHSLLHRVLVCCALPCAALLWEQPTGRASGLT